jgi:hypothetical protein
LALLLKLCNDNTYWYFYFASGIAWLNLLILVDAMHCFQVGEDNICIKYDKQKGASIWREAS